jgi:diguanylate cyclase (GGDEF)-like protein/PAS domain S-box-containing protein
MDLLLDAICMVDVQGRFVFVSTACEQIFGYTQQEMIGKVMIDLVLPADRERTLAAARNIMDGQSHINFENRYVRKDGSIVHIMWSARWSEADQLRVAVARDGSALKRSQAMQAALYPITEAAHASEDLAALFQRTHEVIGELLPPTCCDTAMLDMSTRHLHLASRGGRPPQAGLLQLLCEEVARRGAPLLLEAGTTETLPGPLRAVAARMTGSALAVPLATSQGMVGVLALHGGHDGIGYTASDRELLVFVSDQLAAAIERKQLHAQMRFMAMHDELTRLPNRRLFHDRLATAFARAQRQETGLSVLFIDLNRFKQVNDRYGHVCGDLLLQHVARRLVSCVRDTDTVARLGGDEFVVLLENIELPSDVGLVTAKIHHALDAPVEFGIGQQMRISASIGVAHFPEHGADWQALVSHADQAMYAAKAAARAVPANG